MGERSVEGAAKTGRSENERMACLHLVGKRKLAGSISQVNRRRVKVKRE